MFSLLPPDSLVVPPNPSGVTVMKHNSHGHDHEAIQPPKNTSQYTNIETWPDQKTTKEIGQIGGIALNNANSELVVFHRASRKWESQ